MWRTLIVENNELWKGLYLSRWARQNPSLTHLKSKSWCVSHEMMDACLSFIGTHLSAKVQDVPQAFQVSPRRFWREPESSYRELRRRVGIPVPASMGLTPACVIKREILREGRACSAG